jgi:uncharacterized peroxidase-related enzyme
MPQSHLPPDVPGIRGLLLFRPETAKPLGEFAEILLRGPGTLTRAEREMIAASVSFGNDCHFCESCHAAIAAEHLGGQEADYALVARVQRDPEGAPISEKMKALLAIASLVREDGKRVTDAHVARARRAGATDLEIHDTVLIAAAFCMFNRYVDGLATFTPHDEDAYDQMGQRMAKEGYVRRNA